MSIHSAYLISMQKRVEEKVQMMLLIRSCFCNAIGTIPGSVLVLGPGRVFEEGRLLAEEQLADFEEEDSVQQELSEMDRIAMFSGSSDSLPWS